MPQTDAQREAVAKMRLIYHSLILEILRRL